MRLSMKIILSLLLVYEPLVFLLLKSNKYKGLCFDVFSRDFCYSDSRFIIMMLLPIVLAGIFLLWEKQFIKLFSKFNMRKPAKVIKALKVASKEVIKPKHTELVQKMKGFFESVGIFFAKYFDFRGTAQRSEFWWVMLFLVLMQIPLFFVFNALTLPLVGLGPEGMMEVITHNSEITKIIVNIERLIMLLLAMPLLSLHARRWHDIGYSAHIMWIPFVTSVLLLICEYIAIAKNVDPTTPEVILGGILIIYSVFSLMMKTVPSKLKDNEYRDNSGN